MTIILIQKKRRIRPFMFLTVAIDIMMPSIKDPPPPIISVRHESAI